MRNRTRFICSGCGRSFPLSDLYWPIDRSTMQYVTDRCNDCLGIIPIRNTYSARKARAVGSHTKADVEILYKQSRGLCWWCGKRLIDKKYHIDHRVPLSRGGSDDVSNLCISCPDCNRKKANYLPYEKMGRLL